mmetsp:Transcript_9646/g.23025  ORF Transcript_9646/g.23025 Transcript_9646/m.23025 type:complete len:235 (-) Transcript_9646:78-782(-)
MSSDVEEPAELLCPITHIMFRDPVVTTAGFTYERDAIVQALKRSNPPLDPSSNTTLASKEVVSNWAIRQCVQAFLDQHPNYTPSGWPDRSVPAPHPVAKQGIKKLDKITSWWVCMAGNQALSFATSLVLLAFPVVDWGRGQGGWPLTCALRKALTPWKLHGGPAGLCLRGAVFAPLVAALGLWTTAVGGYGLQFLTNCLRAPKCEPTEEQYQFGTAVINFSALALMLKAWRSIE